MKLTSALIAAFTLLAAAPALAQSRSVDITGYYALVDPQGNSRPGFDLLDEIELDSTSGFGAAINVFFTNRISTEFAAYLVEPEATFRERLVDRTGTSDLEMMPLTVTLQYHFNPDGRIDPYLGAGVAYVLFDELSDFPNTGTSLSSIDVDDDFGYVLNAGLSFDITPNFAIVGDVKYVPVEAGARAVFAGSPGQDFEFEVSPLILSLGLSYQF
jgi:outer membrane protein